MRNNQYNNLDSIVSNNQILLRGGGCSFSCSNSRKNKEKINNLNQSLTQLNYNREVSKQQQYIQIKGYLDLIVDIYKDQIEKKPFIIENIQLTQLERNINQINKVLQVQDNSQEKCCLDNYLELIIIALENLQKNVSETKSISIISLFVQISKQKNNNERISQLIEAAKILLIDVQCRYYTEFQKFETYFFFYTLNQIIKDQVSFGQNIEIDTYFDKIQKQYIQNSTNWILHNYWIEFQVDLLIFCNNIQQQTSNAQVSMQASIIKTYIINQDSQQYLTIYVNNFKFQELQENKWKSIDNSELHRLNRILSVLTSQIKLIETQFQLFQKQQEYTEVYQKSYSIYLAFLVSQICLLEISQQLYEEQEKLELNLQEQSENFDQLKSLMINIRDQIENYFDIKSIIHCYCQLQIIQNSNYNRDEFLKNNSILKLQSQIQQLSKLVQYISTYIRILSTNEYTISIDLLLPFRQGFGSQNFHSIQQSSQNLQEDLLLEINIQLLLFKNLKKLQKIYHTKLKLNLNQIKQEHNENVKQDEVMLLQKIKDLKRLKENVSNMQLQSVKDEFNKIIENINYNTQQYIIKGQYLLKEINRDKLINLYSSSRDFWHELELPFIYESVYQQIEQIIDERNEDEYKVIECIIFHYNIIKENQENSDLNNFVSQQITILFDQQLNPSQTEQLNTQQDNQGISTQSELRQKRLMDIIREKQQEILNQLQNNNIINVALISKQQDSNQSNELLVEFSADQDYKLYLHAEINNFIWCEENRNVVLIISGQIGCGKTNTLKKLEKQLWQIQSQSRNRNWIPIYVDISKIQDPSNQLLKKAIQFYFCTLKSNFKTDIMKEFYQGILKGEYNVVLILDGYDQGKEIKNIIMQNKLQKQTKNCYQKVSLKFIMTTRKKIQYSKYFENTKNMQFTEIQLFNSNQQQNYIKQSYKSLIQNEIKDFLTNDTVQLNNIDSFFKDIPDFYVMSEQVENSFMSKFMGIKNNRIQFERRIQNIMKKMKYFLENLIIPYLKDILLTPQLLQIAIQNLQKKIWNNYNSIKFEKQFTKQFTKLISQNEGQNIDSKVTQVTTQLKDEKFFMEYQLYDTPYLESIKSINLNGKVFEFQDDAELIVLAMNTKRFSKYIVLKQFIKLSQTDQNKTTQSHLQRLSSYLKTNGLQSLKEQNPQENVEFSKIEIDYYKQCNLIIQNDIEIQFLHQQILDFFFAQKLFKLYKNMNKDEYEIIQFLNNDKVNLSEKYYESVVELLIDKLKQIDQTNLIKIVQKSKNNKENIRASSNAIFLLAKMGACLKEVDFKEINIENTSIIGLNAIQCKFSQSKMKNVVIDFCNFNACELEEAQFENVMCSEFPEIQIDEQVLQVISYKQDNQLAVLKSNGIVNIWIIETLEKLQVDIKNQSKETLESQKYKQIIISKDDTQLFALTDNYIDLWNLNNYKLSTYITLTHKSIYLCLSPDNSQLICNLQNSYKQLMIYILKDQNIIQQKTLQLKQDAVYMAINHSNQLLVFKNESNQINFINLQISKQIITQIDGNLLTTTQDGKSFIIHYQDKIIFYSFELINEEFVQYQSFSFQNKVELKVSNTYHSDPYTVLIQNNNLTKIYDNCTKEVQQLPKRFYGNNQVLSGNTNILITWKSNIVQLWDLNTLKITKQGEEIDNDIQCCQYSPDGKNLFIQTSGKSLLLNIETNQSQCIFESIISFCFNPENNLLVTFSEQGLKFWSTRTKDQIQLLFHFDEFKNVDKQKLIFSKNGEWLACINESIVRFMNIKNILGQNIKTIKIKKNNEKQIIVISPKENLYAIQNQGQIQICEYQSSQILTQLSLGSIKSTLAFSQDEKYLAARCSDHKIRIFDMEHFCLICEFFDQFNQDIENLCLWLSVKNIQYIVTNYQNLVIHYNVSNKLRTNSNSSNQTSNYKPQKTQLEYKNVPNGYKCRNLVISEDNLFIAISYVKGEEENNNIIAQILIISTSNMNEHIHQIENEGGFQSAFCPDTKYIAINAYQNNESSIIIWEISGNPYKKFNIKTNLSTLIQSIQFSPTKNYILISDKMGNFSLYDHQISILINSNEQHKYKYDKNHVLKKPLLIKNSQCKIISIKGEYLVYIQNDKLKFEKIETRLNNIKLIPNYKYNEKDQFNFFNNLLSYNFEKNQLIQFNPNQQSNTNKKTFGEQYKSSAFSSQGELIAFVNQDNKISIYNISDQTNSQICQEWQVKHPINVILFSNKDQQLVTINSDPSQITIYQISNQRNPIKIQSIQVIKMYQSSLSLQFHPNDLQFIVYSKNREILLYKYNSEQKQFQKFTSISGYSELQSMETKIAGLKITTQNKQQNLRALLGQKGAKKVIIQCS